MAKRKKVVEQYDGCIYGIDRHGEVANFRIPKGRHGADVTHVAGYANLRPHDNPSGTHG